MKTGPQGRERPLYAIIGIIPKEETHQANQDGTKDHQGQQNNAQAEGNEGHKRGHHITLHVLWEGPRRGCSLAPGAPLFYFPVFFLLLDHRLEGLETPSMLAG